jgi:RNA polymerase sigma factor (sigma-70 family)
MVNHRQGSVLQDVGTLFHSGTVGGLTDAELLSRFVDRCEGSAEPAFALLVQRHGPMVLRVCRSVLRDEHDALDAFQATFLILIRRAAAVRQRGSVGSWLYGVALRVSSRARAAMARRRKHEARAARFAAHRSADEPNPRELAAVLHEELGSLPERYRAAVVLCYLECQTCESAARQLGWPVGTVKSRLARGRRRLLDRLIRRGLGPEDSSDSPSAMPAILSAALANHTAQAMVRFAARESTADLISPTALSWTSTILRGMQMMRFMTIATLAIVGLVATGVAVLATQESRSAKTGTPARRAAQQQEPAKSVVPGKKDELITVRVVDTGGRDMPNVGVLVVDERTASEERRFRTGTDGRFRFPVAPYYKRIVFLARPNDRALGWATITAESLRPQGTDEYPVVLILRPLTHQVSGTIVDSRGKPIRGVRIRVFQLRHDWSGSMTDYRDEQDEPLLGSGITDEAGRYLLSLPAETQAPLLGAYHPRYVGPWISCGAEDQTIPPVTLQDAGGIVGTVIDSGTGKPVAGAKVGAGYLEWGLGVILGGGAGGAISDAHGHFEIGGLAPGVYNVYFKSSPKGRRFTAREVEGVRVSAGKNARADLVLSEGRHLHGTAIYLYDNTPMAGVWVQCESPPIPRSGGVRQSTYADDQGRFEFYVPPGPAVVSISCDRKVVTIPTHRDPEPVRLENNPFAASRLKPLQVVDVECIVRVRVKTDDGDAPPRNVIRTLIGRVFDSKGLPIAAVRVYPIHQPPNGQAFQPGATDLLGVFRLKGVPSGRFQLCMDKDGLGSSTAMIPSDAAEIELTLPDRPNPRD